MVEISTSAVRAAPPSGLSGGIGARSDGKAALRVVKRGLDVSLVLIATLALLPLLLTITLVLLASQGRPLFYRHKRVGKDGRAFFCFKFRTMAVNADDVLRRHLATNPEARAEWEQTRKLQKDPRVTLLGQALRKSSVDELPQFVNVLRGEMSLVGPRPIVQDEVRYYGAQIQQYYKVRPGLTGLWQIGGRNDVSYGRRVQLDAEYVSNWSLLGDLSIMAKTVPAVLRAKGCY